MLPKTILVTSKTNIKYFSGFPGSAGSLVLRGNKGFLLTDARYHLVAKRTIPSSFKIIDTTDGFEDAWKKFLKKYRVQKLGIEGKNLTLHKYKNLKKISSGVVLIDIDDALDKKRMVKGEHELSHMRRAQKITDEILIILKKWLKQGLSEKDIEWKIALIAHELGAEGLSFPPIVAINENGAAPHHQNGNKKLRSGDIVLIDMGVTVNGYCSDMTRVVFTKTPTTEQKHVYEVVLAAQNAAINKLKAGVSGSKIDKVARDVIKKAGYEKYFGHALGHGVGLDIHELPNLSKKYKEKIPAGAVVTIEPGIYLPGKFGIRIEDMVVVTANGVRNLTKSPKSIQDCVIGLK